MVGAAAILNAFVGAIAAAGGPTYAYRQIDPQNDQDGGEPGGNIRVAILFRIDRGLAFVDRRCRGPHPRASWCWRRRWDCSVCAPRGEGGFEVVSVQLKTHLWGDIMQALLPPGKPQSSINGETIAAALAKLPVSAERRKAPLDAATAHALSDTWNAAIDGVRYAKNGPHNDGIHYTFADATEQFRAGEVSTPADGTRMAALAALGEQLFSYGWETADREKAKQKLLADAGRLKAKLRAKR